MKRQQLTLRSKRSSGDSRHVVPVTHRTHLPIQGIPPPDPAHNLYDICPEMSFKRTQSRGQLLCRHTESLPPRGNKVRDLASDIGLQTWHMDCIKSHSESGQTGTQTLLSQHQVVTLLSVRLLKRTVHKRRPSVGSFNQSVEPGTHRTFLVGVFQKATTGGGIQPSRRPWAEARRHRGPLRPVELPLQSIQLLGSCGPPVRHHSGHSHHLALRGLDVERTLDCL